MLSVSQFSHDGGKASGVARQRAAEKRRAQVLTLHVVAGLNGKEIAARLGISHRTVFRDLEAVEDDRIRVEEIIEDCGLNAEDIHITLSKMADADLADIALNPEAPIEQLQYKPIAQWPAIWRQGLAGKVKVTPVTINDGERTPGGDPVRYKVEIEREPLLKILELAAKLKAVDGLVTQKGGDVNVLVITADRARQVQSAKKRLERVIDVKVEKE